MTKEQHFDPQSEAAYARRRADEYDAKDTNGGDFLSHLFEIEARQLERQARKGKVEALLNKLMGKA